MTKEDLETHFDEDSYIEDNEQGIREYLVDNGDYDDEEDVPDDLVNQILQEEIDTMLSDSASSIRTLQNYFDYDQYGRDMSFSGWYFGQYGAIDIY